MKAKLCLAYGWTEQELYEQSDKFVQDCLIYVEAEARAQKIIQQDSKPKK